MGRRGFGFGLGRSRGPSLPAPPVASFTDSVRMLAGFNGADDATVFADESIFLKGNFAVAGDAKLDTEFKKFGLSSLMLSGTGHVSLPDNGHWDIQATDDLQIELFFRWMAGASLAVSRTFISQWSATSNQRQWRFAHDNDGLLKFQYSPDGASTATALSVAFTPELERFYHLAYTRVAGVSRLFVDGRKLAQSGVSNYDPNGSTAPMRIGGQESGGSIVNLLHGHVDEARFCKSTIGAGPTEFYMNDFAPHNVEFPRAA